MGKVNKFKKVSNFGQKCKISMLFLVYSEKNI